MHYDINIKGDVADNGSLEIDRLSYIANCTKDIATKALMLNLRGYSNISPDKTFKKALEIRMKSLSGNIENGTNLLLDCQPFNETIKNLQLSLFSPTEEILRLTPMALVIQSFSAALLKNEDKNRLDKPLLKSLLKFKKSFISDNEVFNFSNRQSIPEISIKKEDFKQIELLESDTPDPQTVIINGRLDELKFSTSKLGLITSQGLVNVFANNQIIVERLISFLGNEVTISGIAHFRPGGTLSYIDIIDFAESNFADSMFSKKPNASTLRDQLSLQFSKEKNRPINPLKSLVGNWPGEESLDEILKELE